MAEKVTKKIKAAKWGKPHQKTISLKVIFSYHGYLQNVFVTFCQNITCVTNKSLKKFSE